MVGPQWAITALRAHFIHKALFVPQRERRVSMVLFEFGQGRPYIGVVLRLAASISSHSHFTNTDVDVAAHSRTMLVFGSWILLADGKTDV